MPPFSSSLALCGEQAEQGTRPPVTQNESGSLRVNSCRYQPVTPHLLNDTVQCVGFELPDVRHFNQRDLAFVLQSKG